MCGSSNAINNIYQNQEDNKLKEPNYICKICFRTDSDFSDPLLSPCKCSGSMGYIHYKCLKQCIKMRITKKEAENYICYLWKNYECEICLREYPKYIKYKNYVYNMIDFNIPYEQYIILDYTLYDDTKKRTFRKGIIIVKIMDEEHITIGRNQTNVIKLKDISVSRSHCYFFKKDNKLFIADKSSKFGTLLYLNKPFTITNNNNFVKKNFNNKTTNAITIGGKIMNNNLSTINTNFIDNQVNLVSGKNFFSFKLSSNWSLFGTLFSNTFCCKCKNADEDFVLNLDDSSQEMENSKELNDMNHSNDSYVDYFMNLDTIIKNNESANVNNNNNSFI